MSKCTITFDNNPFGVYYAGQVVSGTASLITIRAKTIRSIYINVSGFAEVRWTENVTKNDENGKAQKAIETYSASEMYYNSEKYVYGQNGGPQMELPAGKYVFPFQATIAPNAPTSFNGQWGQIQHEVSLVIDRSMRYNNVFKQAFSVLSPYDLNLNPENAKPLHKIEEKTYWFSYLFGRKTPMVMKVNVPFSAYAPGQKIGFHIVLDNQSDVSCSDCKLRLMKRVTYTSRSPTAKTQVVETKIADNHMGEVVKLNKAEFNEFLKVPSTPPSSLESCGIIKISYTLKFIGRVLRLYGGDLIIEFPITIGTVPLYASAVNPTAGSGPNYNALPPPIFEEDNHCEQFEKNTFKPRYPVFSLDANLTNGNNSNNPNNPQAPTQPTNSMYPTIPGFVHPTPPSNPITPPQQKVNPMPTPVIHHTPTPSAPPHIPADVIKTPPYPVASPTNNAKSSPAPARAAGGGGGSGGGGGGLEVLGFSIPPDYKPTQSKQTGKASGGW